jgi:hypothetical protein
MDLPIEVRLLIWSEFVPFWGMKIDEKEITFRCRESDLLRVSRTIRKEVASLATFELELVRVNRNEHRDQIRRFWECAISWIDVHPMHLNHYLSKLRFIFTAENLTQFQLNFVLDEEDDVVITRCGHRRLFPPEQWSPFGYRLRMMDLLRIVRFLNLRKEPRFPRGTYLFAAIGQFPGI